MINSNDIVDFAVGFSHAFLETQISLKKIRAAILTVLFLLWSPADTNEAKSIYKI